MAQWLYNFWLEEDGQDLIEYSLLITFIAIACAALIGSGRPAVNSIWTQANNQLGSASAVASGG
ncbi:MAG: Flp family type IVb pilin [Bryobacteraceae bacterium]